MKTLALLSLSLAVALGMPSFASDVAQNPVVTEEDQSPVIGDWVPVQGHVVVEDPAPQVRPVSEEQQEKLAPVIVNMEQSMVEQEIKVKPQDGQEQEGEVKTEVKAELEVKEEQEIKVEPDVQVEPEVMAELKVDDPDFQVESEVEVAPDVQEEFQAQRNLDAETEISPEIEERHIDMEGKNNLAGEPIMELEPLDDDNMSEEDLSNTELSEVEKSMIAAFQNQPMSEEEEGLIRERYYTLDGEPDVQNKYRVEMIPEAEKETGQEFKGRHIDLVGKYEMAGEPIMELEPLDDDNMSEEDLSNTELSEVEKSMIAAFQNQPMSEEEEGLIRERYYTLDGEPDVQNKYRVEMIPEAEKETGQEFKGRHIDLVGKYEMAAEPIMELEPLDDDNMSAQSNSELLVKRKYEPVGEPIMELLPLDDDNTEKSEVGETLRAAFQSQDPASQLLPEEQEGLIRTMAGEPIMELEPEEEEAFLHQRLMPDAAIMGEGPSLDFKGQQIQPLEEYFQNEEARVWVDTRPDFHPKAGSEYVMMEEPGRQSVREEDLFREPHMENDPMLYEGDQLAPQRERRSLMRQGVESPED